MLPRPGLGHGQPAPGPGGPLSSERRAPATTWELGRGPRQTGQGGPMVSGSCGHSPRDSHTEICRVAFSVCSPPGVLIGKASAATLLPKPETCESRKTPPSLHPARTRSPRGLYLGRRLLLPIPLPRSRPASPGGYGGSSALRCPVRCCTFLPAEHHRQLPGQGGKELGLKQIAPTHRIHSLLFLKKKST